MTLTYVGDYSTDLDKVRFHIGDIVASGGPRPADANYTDEVLTPLITAAGSWERAVAMLLDNLAVEWTRHATIRVGPRSQDFSDVARGYRLQAKEWRNDHNILPGVIVAGVIRVDGYSDDVTSDDVDTVSEYARVKIRTWEYPL